MIAIHNVTKRYGRRVALADVSLTLVPGEVALLLGPNGAGKSTLLRCLLGITDYEGTISVDGFDPLEDGCAVRAAIGYMPQSGGLHGDLTVRDTMTLYARIRRSSTDRGTTLLHEAGLGEHLDTLVSELSGGMRQRLGFALALLPDPRILVLDEPSSSLDVASRRWLAERLRAAASEGRTVIVSTHAGHELRRRERSNDHARGGLRDRCAACYQRRRHPRARLDRPRRSAGGRAKLAAKSAHASCRLQKRKCATG